MLETLLSGGLTGIVGSLISNVTGYFKAKQEHQQAMDMAQLEHKNTIMQIAAEAKYKNQQLTIEAERDMGVAEYAALASSYNSQAAYAGDNKWLVIAEFFNKTTRPAITFCMVFLTTAIYFSSDDSTSDLIARAVVAMTATVISWWFCDRQIAKQIGKKFL